MFGGCCWCFGWCCLGFLDCLDWLIALDCWFLLLFCIPLLFCLLVNSVGHDVITHLCLLVLVGFIELLKGCYGLLCLCEFVVACWPLCLLVCFACTLCGFWWLVLCIVFVVV